MHLDEHSAKVLHSFGVLRFAPVADEEYAGERAALRSWQPGQQAAVYEQGCIQVDGFTTEAPDRHTASTPREGLGRRIR